jgi:hypothetical protein
MQELFDGRRELAGDDVGEGHVLEDLAAPPPATRALRH